MLETGNDNIRGTRVFLRLKEVVRVTGLSQSSVYAKAAKGSFPKQVRLSPNVVGWIEAEILEWQNARIAERDREAT
jgi:prophage regulatory protein